ncbi:unnamed protein product, partial [Rotaria sp. Silwood1]
HSNNIQQQIQFNSNQQSLNLINENNFEILLNRKHIDISECDSTLIIINNFVENIERAMKDVSDKMMEECQLKNIRVVPQLLYNIPLNSIEQTNTDSSESFRMLKGAMKVSILAMHLSLKTDYEYTLVLICANKPTITLLNDICQELTITLNKQNNSSNQIDSTIQQSIPIIYQIETHVIDACLTIKSSLLPQHTIRIMLTSPVFCSDNFLNFDEKVTELNSDPTDMLDKNKCLEAAAEIRTYISYNGLFNFSLNLSNKNNT